MNAMQKENIWVRIGGNAQNIHGRKPKHWRCFLGDDPTEYQLENWSVIGISTSENMIPGSNADRDKNGLVAWLDYYGNIEITPEGIATIHLKNPNEQT